MKRILMVIILNMITLYVFAQEKSYDASTDTDKVSLMNPNYARTTDPEPIISAAQTLTTSYADVGYEISTSGFAKDQHKVINNMHEELMMIDILNELI